MKRALNVTALLAMGFLMATPPATAQDAPAGSAPATAPAPAPAHRRPADRRRAGRDDIASSKFDGVPGSAEGRLDPLLQPVLDERARLDFNLFGYNVRQTDQRYNGLVQHLGRSTCRSTTTRSRTTWATTRTTIYGRDCPGRLGHERHAAAGARHRRRRDADRRRGPCRSTSAPRARRSRRPAASTSRACASAGRPTFDLGKKLPFDLTFTYMRELKSGYRGDERRRHPTAPSAASSRCPSP